MSVLNPSPTCPRDREGMSDTQGLTKSGPRSPFSGSYFSTWSVNTQEEEVVGVGTGRPARRSRANLSFRSEETLQSLIHSPSRRPLGGPPETHPFAKEVKPRKA